MEERLDMVAANKQVGFFSDAYCVEWSYAKVLMVRRQLAEVLAAKVRQGQYTHEQAIQVRAGDSVRLAPDPAGNEAGQWITCVPRAK